MKTKHNVIAVVYDFDGTLSPNNMQEDTIFYTYGIDKEKFWKKADDLVERLGYEPTLSYLKLLLHDESFQRKPLRREDLMSLASKIKYYPGVEDHFGLVHQFMKTIPEAHEWGVQLEYYVISSGMKEILEGAKIFKHFKRVYACEYEYRDGVAVFPKLVINDTNKTQFLFRISKGRLDLDEDINSHMPEEDRRIPFRNIIYVGDSETDVPCMTVVQKYGGHVIAVFDPAKGNPKKAIKMVEEKRADHFTPADFRKNSLLVRILQRTLKKIVHTIAYYSSAEMSFDWIRRNKSVREASE